MTYVFLIAAKNKTLSIYCDLIKVELRLNLSRSTKIEKACTIQYVNGHAFSFVNDNVFKLLSQSQVLARSLR